VAALGIDKELPAPAAPSPEQTYEEAKAVALGAIREASGNDSLEQDDDGDIPVQLGEALLFVHVYDAPRFVRVFSLVVNKVESDEALLQRLNGLNARAKLVRFLFANGAIWASSDLFAHPLVPRHVVEACEVVGEVANDLRDILQREFGEHTVLQASAAATLMN
jgi:hypothetical protein